MKSQVACPTRAGERTDFHKSVEGFHAFNMGDATRTRHGLSNCATVAHALD